MVMIESPETVPKRGEMQVFPDVMEFDLTSNPYLEGCSSNLRR